MAAAAKSCLGWRSDCWKIQEGRIRPVKNTTGESRLFCRSRRPELGGIRSQQKQIRGEPVVVNGNAQAVRLEDEEGAGQPRRLRVAYQGKPGAFSESAATVVHPGCEGVPCKGYEDAIWAVESRQAERAILPVEGTLEGNVVRNYDLLLHHSLQIVDETQLFVNYCLLAAPGVSKSEIRRVISHPTALAHCSHGLAKVGLGGVTREAVEDTAAAAELVREHRLGDTAAIASCRAAGIYGLEVLARSVQDEPWNVTRFLVLARAAAAAQTGDDSRPWKTSIVIAHEGGLEVLMKLLAVFSSHGISLTKLEVRPNGAGSAPLRVLDVDNGGGTVRQFEYVFYIDFDASMANPNAREALEEVRGFATFVRVLGSYVSDPKIHSFD
uniref:arogenate dehydratase n=1 Tax=Wollemia nobilis TaxID=56998 RepID=A0A0C9RWP1_9CONI